MNIFAFLLLFFTWAVAGQIGTGTITVTVGLNATEAMTGSLATETSVLSITKVVIETAIKIQPSIKESASAPMDNNAVVSLLDPGFVALTIGSGIMIVGMLAMA